MNYKKLVILILSTFIINSLHSKELELEKIGTFECGTQPKQVIFSPDSKYIVLPLLNKDGFDIFDMQNKTTTRINPPEYKQSGFAEGLFIPEKKVFLVSQMTTGKIHEYTYPGFIYKRTISTDGTWSKFIAWCTKTNQVAISNWLSNNISLIDYSTGNVTAKLKTKAAPRGLAYIENGKYIISLSFEGNEIEKFNLETNKLESNIKIEKSAMRHIVLNSEQTKAYVSDMYHHSIYELDLQSFTISRTVSVFNNPNTIDLYKNRWLFVSCRGPNNPEDYTKRSPENGKIYIIDTNTMNVDKIIEGGNQPTGLDISPNNKYLCFSNFQDHNIEIYTINEPQRRAPRY